MAIETPCSQQHLELRTYFKRTLNVIILKGNFDECIRKTTCYLV